jgi:hypothetical protein
MRWRRTEGVSNAMEARVILRGVAMGVIFVGVGACGFPGDPNDSFGWFVDRRSNRTTPPPEANGDP